ncbi:RNA polymerase subunit sigma-70 [Kribbella sp. NPDC023855]|uniref:RNA polymerase subunit sigma-70 n=1 Tax=Kribbella sp. NPDC023855 TaxID=3154698 RepID=UPI0033DF2487
MAEVVASGGPAGRVGEQERPSEAEFAALTSPYRAELLAHCQRLLGSRHDAEDQLQETLLRAWRAYPSFEGRSSVRTWLYRIATNVCLTAIERRARIPLPTGLPESDAAEQAVQEWSAAGGPSDADPAAILGTREDSKRALLVAWRHLAPRQRAVLVLADVLGWQAVEIADLLGMSASAVYSMLRRAREQLADARADGRGEPQPDSAERKLLEQYAHAIEAGDVSVLVTLLADDAVCERPLATSRVVGRDEIARFVAQCPAFGRCKMVPITVDGRPGFAVYQLDEDGSHRAANIDALTVSPSGVRHLEVMEDRTMFASLGLPLVLDEAGAE